MFLIEESATHDARGIRALKRDVKVRLSGKTNEQRVPPMCRTHTNGLMSSLVALMAKEDEVKSVMYTTHPAWFSEIFLLYSKNILVTLIEKLLFGTFSPNSPP